MSRPRLTAVAAIAGLVLGLGGCTGGDSEPDAGPATSPSATGSTPSEDGASATPTEDPTSTVVPASGPLLRMPNATLNAPQGWKRLPDLVDFQTEANPRDFTSAVRLGALEYAGPKIPLDRQATAALKVSLGEMKRVADVEIAGVTFYHLVGKPSASLHLDQYGVTDDGYQTGIDFEFRSGTPAAEREQIIAAGLASFAWR